MPLRLLESPSYAGTEGVIQVRNLQLALNRALEEENWDQVRKLDQACAQVIDKVIAANRDDGRALISVLSELKDVYANLIVQCKCEVAAMAH